MNITINPDKCFFCGKKIDYKVDREKHHCIPKSLHPKFNIIVSIHSACHKEINKTYACQQRSLQVKKIKGILEDSITKLTSKLDMVVELE